MARAIARESGLNYVYTGNVHDEAGGSTYCPSCGVRVICRDWYNITLWRLRRDGRCSACGTEIVGVFEANQAIGASGACQFRFAVRTLPKLDLDPRLLRSVLVAESRKIPPPRSVIGPEHDSVQGEQTAIE